MIHAKYHAIVRRYANDDSFNAFVSELLGLLSGYQMSANDVREAAIAIEISGNCVPMPTEFTVEILRSADEPTPNIILEK